MSTSFSKVQRLLADRFPELSTREGWSHGREPRVLLLDSIHLTDPSDWTRLYAQVASVVTNLPGVTVGWHGAEVAVKVERRSIAPVRA